MFTFLETHKITKSDGTVSWRVSGSSNGQSINQKFSSNDEAAAFMQDIDDGIPAEKAIKRVQKPAVIAQKPKAAVPAAVEKITPDRFEPKNTPVLDPMDPAAPAIEAKTQQSPKERVPGSEVLLNSLSTNDPFIKRQDAVTGIFQELDDQVYLHNLRIFIMGAEVTQWITGSVSLSKLDREGINSLSFSLSNVNKAFEITAANLQNRWRKSNPLNPEGRYSEEAKFQIYTRKKKLSKKHSVTTFGPIEESNTVGIIKETRERNAQDSSTETYPLGEGSSVFHKLDEVRFFVQHPFDAGGSKWTCEFSGYIDEFPATQDYINGESKISFTCLDIRSRMQYMRTQINSSATIGNENSLILSNDLNVRANEADKIPLAFNAGFYNDLIVPSTSTSHVLGAMTWLNSIYFILFGQFEFPANSQKVQSYGAVGRLKATQPVRYASTKDTRKRSEFLDNWNKLTYFGFQRSFLFPSDVTTIGQNSFPGGSHSVEAQNVYILIPEEGMPQVNLVEFAVDGNQVQKIDWSSRLELITNLCKSIDYQFYVNGLGDLIFEFPMYDFLPSDFLSFESVYTLNKHTINDTVNDETGTPVTAVEAIGRRLWVQQRNVSEEADGISNAPAQSTEFRRFVFSNVLASRFGPHIETVQFPGVVDQDHLGQLGAIEFNKRLAGFSTVSVSFSYRPYLGVNRPFLHTQRKRLGVVSSVEQNWEIRGAASTSVNLDFIRKRENAGDYRFINGSQATPISYRFLFNDTSPDDAVSVGGFGMYPADSGEKVDQSK